MVTDSAAALPADWVRALAADGRLTVVPMPVMVGADIYGEGEDDIADTIAVALASGKPVKTSRPSPGQFEQAYLRGPAAGLRVRRVGPYFRGTVRNGGLRPPRGRPGGFPGGGPGLAHRRHGAGDGCAGRRGRRGGRQDRGGSAGLRRATAGPHQGLLLCAEPRAAAAGRTDRRRGLALGDHALHQAHPRGGRRQSRSAGEGAVGGEGRRAAQGDRGGRRRRPARRGRPGLPSTTSATRPRPNSSRRSWPTPSPAALPCRSARFRPCWRPTPASVSWR